MKKEEIPTWLYFALANKNFRLTEETETLAYKILNSLKHHAEMRDWNIEKIISFNKHDDANGYHMKSPHE